MGARNQTENSKLNVPGAGSYASPSRIVESQGKTMGALYEIKRTDGKLGPGPGGYDVDKKKTLNVSYS